MWIIYRIRNETRKLFYNIEYAFERVFKGYDDRDVFSFNSSFIHKMIKILDQFNKDNIAYWWKPRINGEIGHYSKEETEALIDTMRFHFQMSDADFVYELKYNKSDYLTEVDYVNYRKCTIIAEQNQKQALKLFTLFFNDLWI